MTINDRYAAELRENRPITFNGVTFYPLAVRDFALYQSARPAMELMLSSLPPKIARMSWFSALKALDDEGKRLERNPQFLGSILRLLAVSLRLEPLHDPRRGGTVYPIRPLYTAEGKPEGVQIGLVSPTIISSRDMGTVREILAEQNGYSLPDENWNTELIEAQRYTEAQREKAQGIVFDLETLVYSVAAGANTRVRDIWDWPIREFLKTQDAIDRKINYVVFTLAECGGRVQFKNGNPYPSWKFARKADLPGAFQRVDSLENAAARELLDDKTNEQ